MQKLNKTKISMAVGASLLAMVGTAQAATAPAAPTLRGTVPLVISAGLNTTDARGLYDGTGYNGPLTVTLNFVDSVDGTSSATPGAPATLSPGGDGFQVNQAGAVVSTARLAGDDVNIYTVGTVNTDLLVTGVTFAAATTPATPGSQQVQATITFDSGAMPAAFRMSAAGDLEWIADIATKAVAANWLPVNLAFNAGTAVNAIQAYDSTAGADGTLYTALGPIAGQTIKNGVAPLPKIGTKATVVATSVTGGATAGDLLVDGVTIDTLTPNSGFSSTNVGVTSAQVVFAPCNNKVDAGARVIAATTVSTTTTVATVQITTPSTTADWNSGNVAADNAAYVTSCFNTGINAVAGTVPFVVGLKGTAPTYTNVYNANTGAAAVVSLGSAMILDNVAPVIVNNGITFTNPTGTPGVTSVGVQFSEPMTLIGMNDLREVLENIYVGTDTLAALSLNSGASPSLAGVSTTAGLSTLTIAGVSATDVATQNSTTGVWTGKSMSVNRGITYQEVNDTNYTANLAAGNTFDVVSGTGAYGEELGGGIMSISGAPFVGGLSGLAEAIPATPAIYPAVAPTATVAWGTDTSALASASSATAPDQIDTITVTFAAGKSVKFAPAGTTFGTAPALAAAKTNADLTANLVVDVHGAIGAPVALNVTSVPTGNTVVVSSTAGVVPGATINDPWWGNNTVAAVNNATNTLTLDSGWSGFTGSTTAYQGTVFQVKPLSATLDTANQITVKLPTALIYNKLEALNAHLAAVYIGYVADGDNAVNNTLVSTDAASTLTSPIRVEHGVLQPAGAGTTAEYANAGAEPVVLPLVFTAVATGGQSTLLTQSIQTNVAGATAGSRVDAYLASWNDTPATDISVNSGDIKSGKITNPGDKVATDLAIEFDDKSNLANAIQAELQSVAKATAAIPGVDTAHAAVAAKLIPVYVKLIRSNDTVASSKGAAAAGGNNHGNSSNGQNYLEARAILSTTYSGAKDASTPNTINYVNGADPVYSVMLNPTTGAITGRLTGSITIKPSVYAYNRGLEVWGVVGSSILAAKSATGLALPGTANLNLLVGVDPLGFTDASGHNHSGTDFGALAAQKGFLLLVYREGGNTPTSGKYTLLTSADPKAANYMPFAPDLFKTTTGAGGIAERTKALLSVTDVKALDLPASYNWALYGLGDPALAKTPAVALTEAASFPRRFVGLTETGNNNGGYPVSFWTGDGYTSDIAMSMAHNAVGVATELGSDLGGSSGPTLSTISDANRVKGAVGLAWANDNGYSDGNNLGKLYVAQATGAFVGAGVTNVTVMPAVVPKLAKGWSLVTVPASGTLNTAVVDAVIKVGAQVGVTGTTLTQAGNNAGDGNGQFTWFAVDGAMPTLTAGEAVFVHAKVAGNL